MLTLHPLFLLQKSFANSMKIHHGMISGTNLIFLYLCWKLEISMLLSWHLMTDLQGRGRGKMLCAVLGMDWRVQSTSFSKVLGEA